MPFVSYMIDLYLSNMINTCYGQNSFFLSKINTVVKRKVAKNALCIKCDTKNIINITQSINFIRKESFQYAPLTGCILDRVLLN